MKAFQSVLVVAALALASPGAMAVDQPAPQVSKVIKMIAREIVDEASQLQITIRMYLERKQNIGIVCDGVEQVARTAGPDLKEAAELDVAENDLERALYADSDAILGFCGETGSLGTGATPVAKGDVVGLSARLRDILKNARALAK